MRIVEVGDDKYHVIQQISEKNKKLVDTLEERYKNHHKDFVLLKFKGTATVDEPHFLLCRKIEDADVEEG